MNKQVSELIQRVFGIVSGIFLYYLPIFILLIMDGRLFSLTLQEFFFIFSNLLYPESLTTFAIPREILLIAWVCLGIGYFTSSGKLHKFLYYSYLVYSLLFQLVAIAYALGTWTMPGDHREESPYPSIIGWVIVYCLITTLIWFMLPKKFKE